MPQDLAALLVEEGAVSKADMDRAVARQAQQGGALDTALLELGLVGEGHLLSFLAHASGLPPAPPDAFKEIDARARRVFPAKVAERHRLAPLALDGRELLVVACHPIDAAAIDEIGFMLSLTLVPHVGVEWRVLDLIHRLYGGQLPARLSELADGSRRAPEPEPEPKPVPEPKQPTPDPEAKGETEAAQEKPEAPPVAAAPEPASPPAEPAAALSIEEAFFAAGEAGTFPVVPAPPTIEPVGVAPPSPEPAAPPSPDASGPDFSDDAASFSDIEPERPKPSGFGGEGETDPLLAALEAAVDTYEELWGDKKPAPAAPPAPPEPAAAVEPPAAPAAEPEPAPPVSEAAPEGPPPEPAAPAEEPREEPAPEPEPEEPTTEIDRSAPPRWSIDDARTALAAARHRDEIVVVALRYARDFFEYSALFAVTRDAVVGHDALGGPEDERARCRATAIYAEDPGIVRTVLETRAPYLGPVVRDTLGTSNILDGLWRGSPRTVLVYPMLIGDRPVAVLYADNGDAPVSARRLGDLLLFLSTVGGTFERVIRARKKRGKRPAAPQAPPPPPVESPAPGPMPDWMEPPPGDEPPEPVAAEQGPETPPAVEVAPPAASAPQPVPAPDEQPPPAVEERSEAPAEARPAPPDERPPSPVEQAMAVLLGKTEDAGDRAIGIVDLVLDPDPGVAAAAREALASHKAEPAVKPLPERLRRALLSGVGERPVLAARALGALRDVDSIPILIQALEGGAAAAAADALAAITLQRIGTSPQRWLKWWKENRGHSRAEWLFAALTSGDLDARVAASGELRAAGEPPVRYTPDMPAAELDAAARAWWVWWSKQGLTL